MDLPALLSIPVAGYSWWMVLNFPVSLCWDKSSDRAVTLGVTVPQLRCSLSSLAFCSVHCHLQPCFCDVLDMTARAIILPPWKAMLHGPQAMQSLWFVRCWLKQLLQMDRSTILLCQMTSLHPFQYINHILLIACFSLC